MKSSSPTDSKLRVWSPTRRSKARPPPTAVPSAMVAVSRASAVDGRCRLTSKDMDGVHDMGGMHGFGPVDPSTTESGHEGWESRLQAVAFMAGAITRAGIEAIEPAKYLDSTYHERWLIAAEKRARRQGQGRHLMSSTGGEDDLRGRPRRTCRSAPRIPTT